MNRPLIGVTTGFKEVETIGGPLPSNYSSTHLAASVWEAGGLPWLLPSILDSAEEVLDRVDALLLAGGGDVDPRLYGDPVRSSTDIDERRDRFEIELIRGALRRDLPVLGACRGVQILTAALGGKLYQDLPSERPGGVDHLQSLPGNQVGHTVKLAEESKLSSLFGAETIEVNSLHHQGVLDVGQELATVGWAEDGLIEAVELPGRWVVGVQWHPELLHKVREEQLDLFRGLVEACTSREVSA